MDTERWSSATSKKTLNLNHLSRTDLIIELQAERQAYLDLEGELAQLYAREEKIISVFFDSLKELLSYRSNF